MNKIEIEPLFPENLTDEAASLLSTFLYDLAGACESRYFTQLRRHHEGKQTVHDPDHPWRTQNTGH
jgi:hypothetical protein